MLPHNLKSLISKLNKICQSSLEAAAGLCLTRTHYNVEIEHWLLKILEVADTDIVEIFRHFDVDSSTLSSDLTNTLESLKTGNARAPGLSVNVIDLAREAWLLASLNYHSTSITSGHLLIAFLANDNFARMAIGISNQFKKISLDVLQLDLLSITEHSKETKDRAAAESSIQRNQSAAKSNSKTPALDQYTVNLTEQARQGKVDTVLGRDKEIRQIIDILTRRRQNNPILTGEPGVGKTAVVEGLALRIVNDNVPAALKDVAILVLDLSLLQAGASMKGEFENRLNAVINEVKSSPSPVIIFIDEAHTMIGAGGQAGQGDAANLLKPALARGDFRTIAATTWAEYKKYFEQDAALTRRFQVVKVDEPSEEEAIAMMRGLVKVLEVHHKVTILDEAVHDCVFLSKRYIASRQLPDKSVSLLDTACARVAMSLAAMPEPIESLQHTLHRYRLELDKLAREEAYGLDHHVRIDELNGLIADSELALIDLEKIFQAEKELIERIHDIRTLLLIEPNPSDKPLLPNKANDLKNELISLMESLKQLQGETPLIKDCVDSQVIADVVASWTGIPVGRMMRDEAQIILNLEAELRKRIIGQSYALQSIAKSIQTSRAKLKDPRKPVGVFLFAGTSGVGKTETALALADLIYRGSQNLTIINMSEFKEEHKVSMLLGSPPGYVGYGEGGVLTEAVRRNPHSLILLDEIEKAHPGVQDIFYQVFDKGSLRDGQGRDIDFKNTVIIMTSNVGTNTISKLCADQLTIPSAEGLLAALKPDLLKIFKPAFLGRTTIVPYLPLTDAEMAKIIELQLKRIENRVYENYHVKFSYSKTVVSEIASRCKEVDSGARNIDHILNNTLLPELSAEFLSRLTDEKIIHEVAIHIGEMGNFVFEFK